MKRPFTVPIAEYLGRKARLRGWLRVSPMYEETVIRNGKRIDITEELTQAFFKGYDEEVLAQNR